MILSIYITLTLFFVISLFIGKLKLHVLEIVHLWIVNVFINQSIFTITTLNLKLFEVSQSIDLHWVLIFKRLILFPILLIWFVDIFFRVKTMSRWLVILLLNIILIGDRYITDMLSIMKQTGGWSFWWTAIEWNVIIVCSLVAKKWFSIILKRDVNTT